MAHAHPVDTATLAELSVFSHHWGCHASEGLLP
jgi:hypothetical protein